MEFFFGRTFEILIQAADRYKKLLSKPCQVHKLETKEGALLCGDDLLGDVIEDKDKLGKSHFFSLPLFLGCPFFL